MSSTPARALHLVPDAPPPLSLAEIEERRALRQTLRLRRSVDHFARGWYGSIVALILTGISLKLWHDRSGLGWPAFALAGLALLGWGFAALAFRRSRETRRIERRMLVRLEELDSRAPKPPELF